MKPFLDHIMIPVASKTTSSDRPDMKWEASLLISGVRIAAYGRSRLAALHELQKDLTERQAKWSGNVQPGDEYATCRYKDGNGVWCPRLKAVDPPHEYGYCVEHAAS